MTRVGEKRLAGVIDLSGELSLTGISSFPKPRTAIIDHKMVRKGDQINGKQVMEIEEERVILKAGEQRYILKMKEVVCPKAKEENRLELNTTSSSPLRGEN